MSESVARSPVRAGVPLLALALITACPALAFQDHAGVAAVVAAPPAEFFPPPTQTELRIEEKFGHPVELNFIDTPLNSSLEFLKEQHGINIMLDIQALQSEKIDPATPVTIQVSGITLQSALNLLLRDLKLTYFIEDDVLKISTHAALAGKLVTRVYPVRDLCRTSFEYDALLEAIVQTVSPNCWVKTGGDCSLVPFVSSGALVVRASHPMHSDIQRLLRTLRDARRRAADVAK